MLRSVEPFRTPDRPRRLPLPLLKRGVRWPVILAGGLTIVGLYALSARLTHGEPARLVESIIDSWIPFLPWTVWIYVSDYPLLMLAILLPSDRRRSEAAYGLLLAAMIGFVIFTLWPTSIIRSSPSFAGVTGLLWKLVYAIDTTTNACPSLHVANTCIAGHALYGEGGAWRVVAPVWACAVILSTLTTKQHYFIDVPGGVLVGIACIAITRFAFTYREIGGRRVERTADERSANLPGISSYYQEDR
jgi:membrane-associated phospholipid phosphatase